ncbi:MAG: AbrB/MazE/SpoVT family DNA-binding domain-containing protein [Qipengyuania sp.]|jgi:putative addiction module antidote|nr:AbrB/MazE/SpoVT family DNA-binding domain-containing protein [Qipengyuania sp.]
MNRPAFLSRRLKITKIGNSAGVVLPKDLLARLNASVGDELTATVEDGVISFSARDPEFEEEMRIAREIMVKRRSALRELAK